MTLAVYPGVHINLLLVFVTCLLCFRNSSLSVVCTKAKCYLHSCCSCFTFSFPLDGTADLIPCISSQTVSTQPNKRGSENADLHTPRQMSGNG